MGDYVYKVGRQTVELSNGETANVATFAYKPTMNWNARPTNEQMHFRSGASKCDKSAEDRSDWIVLGHRNKQTGKIEVEIDKLAKKVGRRGSFSDGWFDASSAETSAVAATLDREIVLIKSKSVMINDHEGEYITYEYDRKVGWKEVDRQGFRVYSAA